MVMRKYPIHADTNSMLQIGRAIRVWCSRYVSLLVTLTALLLATEYRKSIREKPKFSLNLQGTT